jgi:hypothetical protein
MWQGRHQSAQKSTMTGWVLLASITSAWKLLSLTLFTLSAIELYPSWELPACGQADLGCVSLLRPN